jgi:GT2 family glycosyltransferase
MKISFWCVNYNGLDHTIKFIESVLASNDSLNCDTSIIVMDNSETDSDFLILISMYSIYSNILIFRTGKNLGYFGAFNYLLSKNHHLGCDYLLLCNNDLVFELDTIKKLSNIKVDSNVFILCPDVITADGYHQNPQVKHRISLIKLFILDLYFSNYYIGLILKYFQRTFTVRANNKSFSFESFQIYRGIGACYILTPNFLKKFSRLIYPSFLYSEESFISDQVYTNNGVIIFDPSITVFHAESATLSHLPRRITYNFERDSYWISRSNFLKKYF